MLRWVPEERPTGEEVIFDPWLMEGLIDPSDSYKQGKKKSLVIGLLLNGTVTRSIVNSIYGTYDATFLNK